MEQRSKDAVMKDAQMELSKEEYALGMGQSAHYAAVKVAKTTLCKEVCASGMGQR